MAELRVGVLGASSLVGRCVLSLLSAAGWQVVAYTRQAQQRDGFGVSWLVLPTGASGRPVSQNNAIVMPYWICVAPIWVLPDYFPLI